MNKVRISISLPLMAHLLKTTSICIFTMLLASSFFFGSSFIAPSVSKAANTDCVNTADSDQKYMCEASSRKDPSYCNYVTNSDSKSFCMALVNHDPVYCSQIADQTKKKICLALQTNRGQ